MNSLTDSAKNENALPQSCRASASLLEAVVLEFAPTAAAAAAAVGLEAAATGALEFATAAVCAAALAIVRGRAPLLLRWRDVAALESHLVDPVDSQRVFAKRRAGLARVLVSLRGEGGAPVPFVSAFALDGASQLFAHAARARHADAVRSLLPAAMRAPARTPRPSDADAAIASVAAVMREAGVIGNSGRAVTLRGVHLQGARTASLDEPDAPTGRYAVDRAGVECDAARVSGADLALVAAGLRSCARCLDALAADGLLPSRAYRAAFFASTLPARLSAATSAVAAAAAATAGVLGCPAVRSGAQSLYFYESMPLLALQVARAAFVRAALGALQCGCFDADGLRGREQLLSGPSATAPFARLIATASADVAAWLDPLLFVANSPTLALALTNDSTLGASRGADALGPLGADSVPLRYGSLSLRQAKLLGLPLPGDGEGGVDDEFDVRGGPERTQFVSTRLVRSGSQRVSAKPPDPIALALALVNTAGPSSASSAMTTAVASAEAFGSSASVFGSAPSSLRDQRSAAIAPSPLPFSYGQVDAGRIDVPLAVHEAAASLSAHKMATVAAHSGAAAAVASAMATAPAQLFFARPSSPELLGARTHSAYRAASLDYAGGAAGAASAAVSIAARVRLPMPQALGPDLVVPLRAPAKFVFRAPGAHTALPGRDEMPNLVKGSNEDDEDDVIGSPRTARGLAESPGFAPGSSGREEPTPRGGGASSAASTASAASTLAPLVQLSSEGRAIARDVRDAAAALLLALVPVAALPSLEAASALALLRQNTVGRAVDEEPRAKGGLDSAPEHLSVTVKAGHDRPIHARLADIRIAEFREARERAADAAAEIDARGRGRLRQHTMSLSWRRSGLSGATAAQVGEGSDEERSDASSSEDERAHAHAHGSHGTGAGDRGSMVHAELPPVLGVADAVWRFAGPASAQNLARWLADELRKLLEVAAQARADFNGGPWADRPYPDDYTDAPPASSASRRATARYRDPSFAARLLTLASLLRYLLKDSPPLLLRAGSIVRQKLQAGLFSDAANSRRNLVAGSSDAGARTIPEFSFAESPNNDSVAPPEQDGNARGSVARRLGAILHTAEPALGLAAAQIVEAWAVLTH